MGKAAKQKANRLANQMEKTAKVVKQIQENKDNKDFIKMIESMQDDKMYQIKKGDSLLFDGVNASGAYWKKQFLTKKEESDGQEQN
jgi:hypothetical protein